MKIDKSLDFYLQFPIFCDIILLSFIVGCNAVCGFIPFTVLNKTDQLNYISNLISTSVSLAGFILAGLTIIVTFKSSIKAKGFDDSNSALEFLFTTKYYKSIVTTFQKSIIELVLIFIILYLTWICSSNYKAIVLHNISLTMTIAIISSIGRSLYILFTVMKLEFLKKEE